jgi:hypothetical protein
MYADLHLLRKGPLGDLAIDRGARQAGAGKDGLQADDFFEVGHGTCFHSLAVADIPSEARVGRLKPMCKNIFCTSQRRARLAAVAKKGREKPTEDKRLKRTATSGCSLQKPNAPFVASAVQQRINPSQQAENCGGNDGFRARIAQECWYGVVHNRIQAFRAAVGM